MQARFHPEQWALVLGGSSGLGLAAAAAFARHGMSVAVVHRDRRGAMHEVERHFEAIRAGGATLLALNLDALSGPGRGEALDRLNDAMGERGRLRVLLHSIAAGNLKPLAPPPEPTAPARARELLAARLGIPVDALAGAIHEAFAAGAAALSDAVDPPAFDGRVLGDEDLAMTVHAMGTSLISWTQDAFARGLLAADARVLALTSEGNEIAWRGYAAVSAAKAALEAASRSLAVELGPHGVRSNVVQAGVTDTPALRRIPGHERLRARAQLRNPLGRLTRPEDVADVLLLLCTDEARWVNGALLRVDGGERIAG